MHSIILRYHRHKILINDKWLYSQNRKDKSLSFEKKCLWRCEISWIKYRKNNQIIGVNNIGEIQWFRISWAGQGLCGFNRGWCYVKIIYLTTRDHLRSKPQGLWPAGPARAGIGGPQVLKMNGSIGSLKIFCFKPKKANFWTLKLFQNLTKGSTWLHESESESENERLG